MNTVKCVAAFEESQTLEELAVLRMEALHRTGAGYYAYANIVAVVESVKKAEHRAAMAHCRAMETLTGDPA